MRRNPVLSTRRPPLAPVLRDPGYELLLDCLAAVEGADHLFLARQAGLPHTKLAAQIAALAAAGYVEPSHSGPGPQRSALFRLTPDGRTAHDATQRWRFKARAIVLLSALPSTRR
jgi:DNA-binding MarR family transcriptional regulator